MITRFSERGMSLTILGGISKWTKKSHLLIFCRRQVWNCLIFRPCSVFLPGIYASYVLLGIYLRWDNFDGTMLPSYDDEEMENEDGRI
jgi:hypothetical protein